MKISVVLVALFISITSVSCQNKDKKTSDSVPEVVSMAFQKQYPNENDPDWGLDAHGYWEAHFKKKGISYRADYNADGSWIETENSIKTKELPQAILDVIEKKYSNREISEVEHVMSATKGEFYDVEFKQKGKNMDVEFRKDGTIL